MSSHVEFPRCSLRRYAIGASSRVPISRERYDELAESGEIIQKALQLEQTLGIVIENFIEFEEALLQVSLREAYVLNDDGEKMMVNRIRLNRLLMNLLASADAYLDHTSTNLYPIFKAEDEGAKQWHDARKSIHHNSFSYRVMDALRNHALHVALPIQKVMYFSRWVTVDKSDEQQMLNFVMPMLDLEELERDPKFKSRVLDELKKHESPLDVAKLARGYVAELGRLHEQLRLLWRQPLGEAFAAHKAAEEEFYTSYPSESRTGLVASIDKSEAEYGSIVHIATTAADLFGYLASRHRLFLTLLAVDSYPVFLLAD
jgi:hypothetical protein